MKRISILILLLAITCSPLSAYAEQPSKDDMMKMLKLSGAVDVLVPMMDQMVASIQVSIQKQSPDLQEGAVEAIQEELQAGSRDMLMQLLSVQIEYFAKHLTKAEVLALNQMYESAAWKKNIKVNQMYIQDKFPSIMKTMVPNLSNELLKRVRDRLKRDGYLDAQDAGV